MEPLKRYRFRFSKYLGVFGLWLLCASILPALTTGVIYSKSSWYVTLYFFFHILGQLIASFWWISAFLGSVLLILARHQSSQVNLVLIAFALITGCGLGNNCSEQIKYAAGEKVESNGLILVRAITAYQKEQGQPPPSLDALVPRYLKAIPRTGLPSCPELIYYVEGPRDDFKLYNPPTAVAPNVQIEPLRHARWTLEVSSEISSFWREQLFYRCESDKT